MAYAATFAVEPPEKFDKAQIGLRVVIVVVIGWLANSLVGAAYWLLPIIAAIMIRQKGAQQYLAEAEQGPVRWLRYIMGFYSYIALASDKLPFDDPNSVNLHVQPTGSPTVGSALLRIILAIPNAIVLGFLGIVFFFVWIISAVSILINGTQPEWAGTFIVGFLRWNARLLSYMTSLVDEYPPFSLNGDDGTPAPAPPAATPPQV